MTSSLLGRIRSKLGALGGVAGPVREIPEWAAPLMVSTLKPLMQAPDGAVRVWAIRGDASKATITEQFKANAGEYHRRYAASDHFEGLFRQALDLTKIKVAEAPRILDLGSGSGVNSIVPCRRLFPGARMIATDLSGELLEMLADYLAAENVADEVLCVKMDAMSAHAAEGAFDLVTGAAILHHLDSPAEGLLAACRSLKPGGHAIFFEPFNGWSILRLAYQRILAEAALRGAVLEPAFETALRLQIADIAARSRTDRTAEEIKVLDDKWLFSRTAIERMAADVGFAEVRFAPHNDHPSLYRDVLMVNLRLQTGGQEISPPEWALAIMDEFDAALPLQAKRELMIDGTIVLTKAR